MHIRKYFKHHFHPLWILIGIVGAVVLAFLLGLFVMLLWNWLMPAIFGLTAITYWQAWGLVLLSHILFKSGHHGHRFGRHHLHGKEWKEKFRQRMHHFHDHLHAEEPDRE